MECNERKFIFVSILSFGSNDVVSIYKVVDSRIILNAFLTSFYSGLNCKQKKVHEFIGLKYKQMANNLSTLNIGDGN